MGCRSSAMAASPKVVPRQDPPEFHTMYSINSKIGKGAYATVYAAIKKEKQAMVAVKIRSLHSTKSGNDRDQKTCVSACKEVSLWSQVGSDPNCVSMLESFFDDDMCYIVMEKCSSSLIAHIENLPSITERSLSKVFSQMLMGIAHIHTRNIVHRDIKEDNLLVGRDGKTVKLTDFGLSAYVPAGGQVHGVAGTAPYMCPEMLLRRCCDFKADVWSFGALVHLLLTGQFPYGALTTADAVKNAIATGGPVRADRSWLTPDARGFLKGVLERNPLLRLSAEEALDLAYFKDFRDGARKDEAEYLTLKAMLKIASTTGAFTGPNLHEVSPVDVLLCDLQKGKAERKASKVLAQNQISWFLTANPEKMNEIVDAFWLPGAKEDKESHDESITSKSTNCDQLSPSPTSTNSSN